MAGKRYDSFFIAVVDNCLQIFLGLRNFPSVFFKHFPVVVNALIHCVIDKAVCLPVYGYIFPRSVQSSVQILLINLSQNALGSICSHILGFPDHNIRES